MATHGPIGPLPVPYPTTGRSGYQRTERVMARQALSGPGHHHGGGGYRGYGPGYGYPWQAPAEVVYIEQPSSSQTDEFQRRAMAHIMSLPKAKRGAAYRMIFGKEAPNGALGDDSRHYAYQNADTGVMLTWKYGPPDSQHAYELSGADLGGLGAIAVPGKTGRKGIFANPTLNLPSPGAPEILVHGMNGLGACCSNCARGKACSGGMGAMPDLSDPKTLLVAGVGVYLLYKHLKKKRR